MMTAVRQRQVSLGTYPYTYARVSFMRSFLLKRDDYERLLKMSLNEIISFLESSQYKQEIDELAVSYSGTELMELALNRSMVNTLTKLRRISPKGLHAIISAYLERHDLWNLKTILRGKHTGAASKDVVKLLFPAGHIPKEKLLALLEQPGIEDVIKNSGVVSFEAARPALDKVRETGNLLELENLLDKAYYGRFVEFAHRIPKQGSLFRKFIQNEVDVINLVNSLRLKKMGVDRNEIRKYLVGASKHVAAMIDVDDVDEVCRILSSRYSVSEHAVADFRASGSLIGIELELNTALLRKATSLLSMHPLSVDVILGYMFAKEVEVRNLKLLLRARQLGLDDDFISKQLII